eukprot:s619_g32.t1
MPLNAELKLHFHASKRSQIQGTSNFWQIRSRNNDGQEKASFTLLKPPGWSEEAASMVHFGYFRLSTSRHSHDFFGDKLFAHYELASWLCSMRTGGRPLWWQNHLRTHAIR